MGLQHLYLHSGGWIERSSVAIKSYEIPLYHKRTIRKIDFTNNLYNLH